MTPKNIDEIVEELQYWLKRLNNQNYNAENLVDKFTPFLRSALKSHTAYILEQLPEEEPQVYVKATLGYGIVKGYNTALADVREKITKLI